MAFQMANNTGLVTINTGNTNLNGTGSITTLFTAGGTYGSVLSSIRINSAGTVPVGMVRIFIRPTNVGTWTLLKEVMIPSTIVNYPPYPVFATSVEINLSLMNAYQIGVSTQTNDTFIVTAFGFDITGFI